MNLLKDQIKDPQIVRVISEITDNIISACNSDSSSKILKVVNALLKFVTEDLDLNAVCTNVVLYGHIMSEL